MLPESQQLGMDENGCSEETKMAERLFVHILKILIGSLERISSYFYENTALLANIQLN